MKSYPVYHVDAFTSRPFSGNPAGVVLETRDLDPAHMQLVARELGHSATAFVGPSESADYSVRCFTPAQEVDLCGHASIAAAWVLASEGRLQLGRARFETGAGILELEVDRERIGMELAPPKIEPVEVTPQSLASILGVGAIDTSRPVRKSFSGTWSLIVPLPNEKSLNLCRPNGGELAALSVELGVSGACLYVEQDDGSLYTRFFVPALGVPEDPVTGTAAGALCGHLVLDGLAEGPTFRVRQGDAVGRPGMVDVRATRTLLRITGESVILSRGKITF